LLTGQDGTSITGQNGTYTALLSHLAPIIVLHFFVYHNINILGWQSTW